METQQIETHRLLDALDALKDLVPRASTRARLALYFYLCSFTLISEALSKRDLQAMPFSMAEVSQWTVQFISEYEDEEDFDKTFLDFSHWIKLKQMQYLDNML